MATRNPAGMPKILFDQGKNLYYTKMSYTDRVGKLCRKSLYGKNPSEVAAKIKQFNKDKDAGLIMDADKITFGQWLLRWLETDKKNSLEITSYSNYQTQINLHIIPALGGTKLKKLQRIQLQEFFNQKAKDLKPASLTLIKAIVVNSLKAATVDGYIIKSPAMALKLPTVKGKEVKPLNKVEIGALLTAGKGSPLYSMIYTAIHTGMRVGELAGLRWQDVELKAGVINVRQGVKYHQDEKAYKTGSTKTENAVRMIPINSNAVAELKRHKAKQAAEKLEFGEAYDDNGLVFTKPGGAVLSLSSVRQQFGTIVKHSGIDRRTFHDLRHTFASICISQKVNIKALSQYLGHATITITLDTYGHLLPGDKEEIAETIGTYLAGI